MWGRYITTPTTHRDRTPSPVHETDRPTSHNRYLNRYTGLNYLFDLNRSLSLDALTVGNETRYLNHDKDFNVTAYGELPPWSPMREGIEP